ncbi:hypothetical protein [Luteipulveratus halotolerans]|uniref:Uncharacterized protein n=1 Tax=Luteipulveratus halotolerans TaxID=1631356 RepID=A0A0L6CKG3_9MICO|nr:hypothetical protein [Luteipulveratus halotolerans]KNX37988.1 hypothetical protein VV01_13840 [Luteipulveratus halotolerans]
MTESADVATRFADEFASWAVTLPAPAIEQHRDGTLYARGWSIRWCWHTDGALEVRSSHRMTDERWSVLQVDGSTQPRDVPAAMMAYMPGDDVTRIRAEHKAAWSAHGEKVTAAGMDFGELPDSIRVEESTMIWRCDGDDWTTTVLPPRPAL